MTNITRLPLPYRKFTDTELELAFWHLSTAMRELDSTIQGHKKTLPFTGGMGFPGPASGLITRWQDDLKTLDQQMQEVISIMTKRRTKLPDYATGNQSASDEWQAVFDKYEEHLGGSSWARKQLIVDAKI